MSFLKSTLFSTYRVKVYPNYWDLLALAIVLGVIGLLAWDARQMATPYQVGQVLPISLSPRALPFYAIRTVTRMLIALAISFLFTFIFGTCAAKSERAEKIIVPMIDVLQSIPTLGYLSVAVTFFITLFPGSLLGPECAVIFVLFTSQAWNMAFSFYQTVKSVPAELQEAATLFHLSAWQRFWRIEVPFSMPGLLWNTMMSMSAGWFFVVASEAITISHQEILLPGIGSYIASAIAVANLSAIMYAVLMMFVVIIIYDQLLFRPLVAWAEKFKTEKQGEEKFSESWLINLFRRTRLMRLIGRQLAIGFDAFVNISWFSSRQRNQLLKKNVISSQTIDGWWNVILFLVGTLALVTIYNTIIRHISWHEAFHVFYLGILTGLRVFILILLCSLLWVPLGVWIGLRPHVAQLAQPIAQIFAAFPANLLYPFIVMLIVTYQLNPNIWLTPLMILGAQWYILFNVIAGASTIPKDLLQVTDNLGAKGWLRWRALILPGIFPYYVTGAITAAGGAWNASIVAEVASWGHTQLVASGLGAYITQHVNGGNFSQVSFGILVMCAFVLLFNQLLWRPLYLYAINRFSLE